MVYKRYIKKRVDGKIKTFGPYYYESYRDKNGIARTKYVNKPKKTLIRKTSIEKKYRTLFFIGIIALLFVITFVINNIISDKSYVNTPHINSKIDSIHEQTKVFYDKIVTPAVNDFSNFITGFVQQDENETIPEQDINVSGQIPEQNITQNNIKEQNITFVNETQSNTSFLNETSTNITITNETILNVTEQNITVFNETIVNITTGNAIIKTIQYGAVLGKPVKWKKKIMTDMPISINIELPKQAENISVFKLIEETKEKISEDKIDIKITGDAIKGKEFSKSAIINFFKKIFNKITGRVIDIQEIKEVTINENATEFEIEYETPAPVAYESSISAGKEIIISGSEEIHYENVLAFTELPREISINSISSIRLYHIVNETKSPVNFDSYDTNNNSLIDYIEWVVPSLSNQTYELIIEITKAEHLDSNRAFISDIYNEVKALDGKWSEAISNNEYVRVTFETPLDNTRDITLYPRIINGTPRIKVYEANEDVLIAEFTNLIDNQYNKVYLTNLSECYDNETEILSDKGWKLFKDLDKSEKVLTLNPETNEKEWNKPYRYQTYEHNSEMYKILLEDGSELLVSPEHKVYSGGETQILRNFLNSSVLNIFTEDCFLKSGSLDQIAQLNFNASANIGMSLSCVNCFALDSNCLNNSLCIISMNPDSSDNTLLNCSELSLEYFNTSDLFFFNSSIEYCGENNLNPIRSEFTIINLTGLSLKNESNIFVSTTNCISYHPSFLYLFHTPSLILSPSFKQSSSVNSEFSSILSNFLSNKALLTFSDKNLRIDSDTLSSGSSSNCFFNSSGMDKVMFGILLSPDILNSVCSVKDVQVYKSFSLQPITDVYSEFEDGESVYFLDSENNPIKAVSITKEDYTGKIYDVTVDNHIILVKRHNSSAIWSGNSQTQDVFDLRVVGGNVEFEHIVDPSIGWNISAAIYESNFSVANQDTSPEGLFFKSDGSKMYIIGNVIVYQYNLSDAWNISSAVYDNINLNVTNQDASLQGLFFKSDGSKMYLLGSINDSIYQYNLSDAWNISSAVYDNINLNVTNQDTSPQGLFFKSDGSKMYLVGSSKDRVHQYNLSDAWNISSAVYDSINFSVANQDNSPLDIFFKSDGSKMYMVGMSLYSSVYQYNLSDAWNISSAVYDNVNFNVANQDILPRGLFFKSDGSKMYIAGDNSDKIYQYSLLDSIFPNITITYPSNNTNSSNNLLNVNYTASDETEISSCWYSNDTMSLNITLTNCANITTITWSEGQHNVTIWANDTSNNTNSISVRFTIDTINPQIDYGVGTENSGINLSQNNIYVNVTFTEINFGNITFTLRNDTSTLNSTTFTTPTYTINWTNLADNNYTYFVNMTDTTNNKNSTTIRIITIDTISPLIDYGTGTANSSNYYNRNWIYVNVSMTETNFKNITFYLFNTTGLVNSTAYTSQTFNINFTNLTDGNYSINVSVYDNAGNKNSTATRTSVILDATPPAMSYGAGTQSNLAVVGNNWVYVNLSVTEANENTIIFNLYNSTHTSINSSSYTDARRTINWTNLSDGVYYYNVSINDTVGASSSSDTNRITLDTTFPSISLSSPADAYSSTSTSVVFQYTVSDAQETNCTLILDGSNADFESNVNFQGGTNSFTNTTSVASHTWRISCTDLAGNTGTSSSRTFTITSGSSSSSSSSSGGGGGGGSVTPTIKTFDLDKEQTSVKLKQGETKELEFVVTNTGKSSLNIYVNSSIKEMMNIAEPNISLAVGESKTITVDVIAEEGKTPNLYLGKIYVKSGGLTKEILVSIEIVSADSLFDIVLEIPKKYQDVLPGEEISFKVSLTRMVESDRKDVVINYTIKDEEGNLIISSEDTKAIETSMGYVKEVKIPEETKYGKYVLYVQVIYEGKVASANQWFNVVAEKKFNILYSAVFGFLVLSIITTAIILIAHLRRKKINH